MTDTTPECAANQSNTGENYPYAIADKNSRRYQSRAGYWFDLDSPTWRLDKNIAVSLGKIRESLRDEVLQGFIATLAHYAITMSSAHTRNIADRFTAMFTETGTTSIETSTLINYRASLDRHSEWKLATIRGVLYKWHDLGHPGISNEVIGLLKSWKLKGNIRGDAVKRLDPDEGPLTDNELTSFNEGVVRAFEQSRITLEELAMCLLISHTGRRPKQIAQTKVCDLDDSKKNKKDEPIFLIHIPRTKQRGEVFRDSFKTFAMSLELWTVLSAQRKNSIASVERVLGYELQETDRSALPLFPDLAAFERGLPIVQLRSQLGTDHLHLRAAQLTETLRIVVAAAKVISERTGQLLNAITRRFRYTKGTRAAREGFGLMVIAELLDHSDIQNVDVYTKNLPEHAQALNKAMAVQLAPYAQAFQGVLVDREADAIRGADLSSRIKFKGQNMATCGQYGFCGANAPIPCYTCNHFQPWLDGPHEEVLADLLSERDRVREITGDMTMASINDRTIFAVINVIQRCEARRTKLAIAAQEAGQ